jgi:hypothetical protein
VCSFVAKHPSSIKSSCWTIMADLMHDMQRIGKVLEILKKVTCHDQNFRAEAKPKPYLLTNTRYL